jgi:hypothetical protein
MKNDGESLIANRARAQNCADRPATKRRTREERQEREERGARGDKGVGAARTAPIRTGGGKAAYQPYCAFERVAEPCRRRKLVRYWTDMPSSKRDGETPSRSGQRVSALDERLAELRAKLDARVTPVPADPIAPAPPAPAARTATASLPALPALPAGERATDVESLALLVFNSLKGDPTKVKQLVHALGRLEAKSKASSAK